MSANSIYDDLVTGLKQAIEFEKGTGTAKVTNYVIQPLKTYDKTEIKRIRNHSGMSQTVFADYMGVSKKTVEAWECGRNKPTGSACRLLTILDENAIADLPFVKVQIG